MSIHGDITVQRERVETEVRKLRQLLTTAVVLRSGTHCHYCGVPTIAGNAGLQRRTLDHVIPQSFGGKDDLDNLVLACASCNSKKGAAVARSLLCPRCQNPAVPA